MFGKADKKEFANSITQKEREVDKFHPNDLLILHGSFNDNSILISLSIQENYVQVNLILQLNGAFYKHTGISAYNPAASSTEITIDGFRIELREAFRRLRITFRGCLAPEGSNDPHFVHLQSNWAPVSDGIFVFHDMPSKVKAQLMAEKVWSKKVEMNPSFYQFGALRLRWKIDDDPWHEGDFRGCRIKFSDIHHDYYLVKSLTSSFTFNGERSMFFEIHTNGLNVGYGKVLNSDHTEKDIFLNPRELVGTVPVPLKFNSGVNLNAEIGKLRDINGNGIKISFENSKKITFSPRKKLEYTASAVENSLNVVSFFNFCCLDSNVSGGKASNLARLCGIQKDFKVPKGVAVTVAAYGSHLNKNEEILEFVNGLTSSSLKTEEIEERANQLFLSSKISVDTNASLKSSLEHVFGNNLSDLKFAVRSSAVGEDGAEMSSAGQLESYLNLRIDEVSEAVLKCWASNFRKEVVAYRREHGLDLNVPVAVVVQEMVTDGISGVMFTVDPVSLNPNQIVINMIEGCGEDLVSGHKTPTQIMVSKSTGEIVKQIGHVILTSEIIKNLADVSKYLETHFDHPQDIEFVIKNAVIYIVQSRNITNLHNESDWELLHEFDSALLTDYQIGCTANVGEVMTLPFSPMDSSTIMFSYTYSITSMIHHLNAIGRTVPKHPHSVMFLYKNKVFLDAMECYLRDWDNVSKDAVSQINLAGTRFITEEMVELAKTRFPEKPGIERLKALYRIYKMITKESKEFLEKMRDTLAEMKLSVHGNDLSSWVETLNVLADYLTKLIHFHAFESAFSNVAYVFVAMLLRGTSDGDLPSEILTAIASVYSNNPYSIISGDIPISLKSIALTLKSDNDALKILNSDLSGDEKVEKLKKLKSEVGIKVREFFQKHGHRGHHELLLLGVTYNEDADGFIQTLKTLLSDPKLSPSPTKPIITDIGELIDSLNLNITGIRRQFLKYLIPNAFRAVFYREEAKNWLVDGTNVLRMALKNVGKLLVKQRYIPDEKLVFFLTLTEIRQLVDGKDHISSTLSLRARRRLRVYNQLDDLQYPLVFIGTPNPKETFIPHDNQQLVLRGTAVCEGKVKGRARVAKTFAEAQNISSDEILITVCTDIAWSPLFPVIKGLVTEIGGLLSHGAVVAREYGLPCVIAVEGATDNFKTGDHVLLDAFAGTIQRVPGTSNGLTPP